MKTDIHPKYFTDTKVTCVCGNHFVTGATVPEIKVEVCSACHPFYSGRQRFVDQTGRLERFNQKLEAQKNRQPMAKKERLKKGEMSDEPNSTEPAAV